MAIESATRAIEAGEHVHLHNMKSDYLPTYALEKRAGFHSLDCVAEVTENKVRTAILQGSVPMEAYLAFRKF